MSTPQGAQGIDLSSHNGTIRWDQLMGLTFALTRATTGMTTVDTLFADRWSGIKAARLVRGAYHFYWATSDPVKQAEHFASTVSLEADDLPPVLDFEASSVDAQVDSRKLVTDVATFLNTLEDRTGRRPMIYTNPSYWNERMCVDGPPPWTARYPLWVSHWTQAESPTLPKGWDAWQMWQYSNRGSVPGISGSVDLNVWGGTAEDLQAWLAAAPPG